MATEHPFFEHPILNSPYEEPRKHGELDKDGQPTQQVVLRRRSAEFISPIPKPRKRKGQGTQTFLELSNDDAISTKQQQYASAIINDLRAEVDGWRKLPSPSDWNVSPETARLLEHWRSYKFTGVRSFLSGRDGRNGSVAKFQWPREDGLNTSGAGQVRVQVVSV